MRRFINKISLIVVLIIPLSCNSQKSEQYGLTNDQYEIFQQGYRKMWRDPEKAIVLLDSLLKIKPDLCPAIGYLGRSHYLLGNLTISKENYKKGIACNPTLPFNYGQLKTIYMDLEQYDSAEFILLEWLEYADDSKINYTKTIYEDLGKITRSKHEYHKSVEYLTEAINRCYDGKKYTSCGDLYYLRADSYSIIEEPEKAWADILVHEQLNPKDRATLVLKGEILQLLGKYSESTKILKEYLTNPTNLGENWVNFMIGVNYHHLREVEESCIHLKEAARLGYEDKVLDELLKNCI